MLPLALGLPRRLLPQDRWDRATLALLFVGWVLVAVTFRQYGSTWDERVQAEVGRNALAWLESGGRDQRALTGGSAGDLHLYGGVFEVAAELAGRVLPFDPFETRHLLNAFVALLGALGTGLLARRIAGARAAAFALVLLFTTPPWWGHGFANSKDIPFATAYVWLLLALLRFSDGLPRPGARTVLGAGAALGMALAVRPGGLVLLLPMGAAIVGVRFLPVLLANQSGERRGGVLAVAWRLGIIVALGWLGMLALWPYGLRNPISGPAVAVAAARHFRWEEFVRFAGGWVHSTQLPRSYVPRWFLATLPESWFAVAVAGAAAAAFAWRRDRLRPTLSTAWLDRGLVAAAVIGPVGAAMVTRPVLYDGVRHFLFVLPPLAALGGWLLSAALARLPRGASIAVLAATAGAASLAVVDAVRLHPYQYVYFNRLVAGGIGRAALDYELDYWGASGREAMAWVVENVRPRGGGRVAIATTADSSVASHWVEGSPELSARFVFDPHVPADLRLATTRGFDHRTSGRVLHVVERMGTPLLYVLDTDPHAGGPLVLEAGDLAVAFPDGKGWTSEIVRVQGDERAAYVLRRGTGAPAKVEAWLLTPRSGPVPDVEGLRARLAGVSSKVLGDSGPVPGPRAIGGQAGRGWVVTGELMRNGAPRFVGVGAVRVGGAALVMIVQADGDSADEARELEQMLAGVRLATERERRRP